MGKQRGRGSTCDKNWSLMQAEGGVKAEPAVRHVWEYVL